MKVKKKHSNTDAYYAKDRTRKVLPRSCKRKKVNYAEIAKNANWDSGSDEEDVDFEKDNSGGESESDGDWDGSGEDEYVH